MVGYLHAVQLQELPFRKLGEGDVAGHVFYEEGKILVLLLLAHGIFQGDVHVRRAVHPERISGDVGRFEERKALNVVPVQMGEQKGPVPFPAAE